MVKVVEFANDLPFSCDLEQGKIVGEPCGSKFVLNLHSGCIARKSSDATVQLGLVFGGKPATITSPT